MNYTLPKKIIIDGIEHQIRNACDFRVVLDAVSALNDPEFSKDEAVFCAMCIFYDDIYKITNLTEAAQKMMWVINLGEDAESDSVEEQKPLMNWEYDFPQLVAPVSHVIGYDVRSDRYTHWWSSVSAFFEIDGECMFAQIISIRNKKRKNIKLAKHELDFYRENHKKIDLPLQLTAEEEAELYGSW
jgi:hypothetical protein